MARDPNLLEISRICESEESAIQYAEECALLPVGGQERSCWKPNCDGNVRDTKLNRTRPDGSKYVMFGLRCKKCKGYKSVRGGDAAAGGNSVGEKYFDF